MNINLIIASLVYAITYQLLVMMLPTVRAAGFESRGELAILQAVCVVLAYLAYYVTLPRAQSRRFSASKLLRFALAATIYVVTAYVALRYVPAVLGHLQHGIENLPARLTLRVLGVWVVPYLAPPVMFLATLWLTANNKKNIFRQSFSSLLTVVTLVAICFDVYLAIMLANDHTGWSGLVVIPMFVLSAVLFLLDAILLIRAGTRVPKDNHRLRNTYLVLGTIFGVLVAAFVPWFMGILS